MSNHEKPDDDEEIKVEEGPTVMQSKSETGPIYGEFKGGVLSEDEIKERQKSGKTDDWREQP